MHSPWRRHDSQADRRRAAALAYLVERYDWSANQARVPSGQPGGGRFASGGGGGGGAGKSKSAASRAAARAFTNPVVERAKAAGAGEKQLRAIREIEYRGHRKRERAAARLTEPKQQTLFTRAPKGAGYRVKGQEGPQPGVRNKALVHEAGAKGLAEHAARVARKTTPPPSAAPHATAPAAAALRSQGEQRAAIERLKSGPRIHGDKTAGQLDSELRATHGRERDAAEGVARAERRLAAAEKAGDHDAAHERRRALDNERESHATATTRRREVESEIAHREGAGGGGATQPAAAPAPRPTHVPLPASGFLAGSRKPLAEHSADNLDVMSIELGRRGAYALKSIRQSQGTHIGAPDEYERAADPRHPKHGDYKEHKQIQYEQSLIHAELDRRAGKSFRVPEPPVFREPPPPEKPKRRKRGSMSKAAAWRAAGAQEAWDRARK